MADTIQTKYESMTQVQNKFNSLLERVAQTGRQVQEQGQNLREEGWEGRGSDAFYGEMNDEILPAIRRLTEALQGASQSVAQVVQNFRQAEEEARSGFTITSR